MGLFRGRQAVHELEELRDCMEFAALRVEVLLDELDLIDQLDVDETVARGWIRRHAHGPSSKG